MNPVIRYSALFLLLLFVRVMVPDALMLSLHTHAHAEHKMSANDLQAKVEKEHKHCPVEDLFEASFQGTTQPSLSTPVQHQTPYAAYLPGNHTIDVLYITHLRGPPVV